MNFKVIKKLDIINTIKLTVSRADITVGLIVL